MADSQETNPAAADTGKTAADVTAMPVAQYVMPPRLGVPREQAQLEVRAALKIGQGIYSQRIRDRWELDQARQEKMEWTQRTTDLLLHLFGGDSRPADSCNDWVSQILPEYADIGSFIEQFENEMRHRITRLKTVLKQIETAPIAVKGSAVEALEKLSAERPTLEVKTAVAVPGNVSHERDSAADPGFATPAAVAVGTTIHTAAAAAAATAAAGAAGQANASAHGAAAPTASAGAVSAAAPHAGAPATGAGGNGHVADLQVPAAVRSPAAAGAEGIAPLSDGPGILIALSPDAAARSAVQHFAKSLGIMLFAIDRESAEEYFIRPPAGAPTPQFAILLVEPEDVTSAAGHKGAAYSFALGCCVGKLGATRTSVLVRATLSSMIAAQHGIGHIPMDGGSAWQLALARELKKSGIVVDLNRLA